MLPARRQAREWPPASEQAFQTDRQRSVPQLVPQELASVHLLEQDPRQVSKEPLLEQAWQPELPTESRQAHRKCHPPLALQQVEPLPELPGLPPLQTDLPSEVWQAQVSPVPQVQALVLPVQALVLPVPERQMDLP